MAQKLRITYLDGRDPLDVLVMPKAHVAFERQFGVSMKDADHVEHVYYMAWAASHFAGKEPKDFDAFLDVLADVDDVTEVKPDDEDPTPPAPSAGDS